MFSSAVRTGEEFADPDVVSCYAQRAPYPLALYERLGSLAVGSERLLDMGCGPGKLAVGLAGRFREVIAVDPSHAMLEVARRSSGEHPNVIWTEGRIEDASLSGPFDLATAGAAIHWMRADVVMPQLASWLAPGARLALVDGDAPAEAEWMDLYRAHIVSWVERGGAEWRDPEKTTPTHLSWIDVEGEEIFPGEVTQSLDSLIEAEHSRATWSRSTMGGAAAEFDRELRALLSPFANEGLISYRTKTKLLYGRPRTTARASTANRRGS